MLTIYTYQCPKCRVKINQYVQQGWVPCPSCGTSMFMSGTRS